MALDADLGSAYLTNIRFVKPDYVESGPWRTTWRLARIAIISECPKFPTDYLAMVVAGNW